MYDPKIFKTYDIRGIYPSQLDEDVAYKIGRAVAEFLKADALVVGRDMRLSGEKLFQSLARGINDAGCDVIDIGMASTPLTYFAIAEYNHEGGIVISASHNPSNYNGFKICQRGAIPISAETGLLEIKKLVEKAQFKKRNVGQIIQTSVLSDYIQKVLELIDQDVLKNSKLKVVADFGNGMGAETLSNIFNTLGLNLLTLYAEPDGSFPNHEPNPLKEENLKHLKEKVIKEKADLGVALDGDADRIGFVDERGETVRGDIITALLAKEVLKNNPGAKILYDLRSSWATPEEIKKAGGIPIEYKVGHALIKEKMRKEGAIFAGELSMHFYWKDFFGVENADLAVLKIMELIVQEQKPLSVITKPILRYFHSGEINFEVQDKEGKIKEIEKIYGAQKGAKVSYLDGLKIEFEDWWFNLRPSNTEPLLRLNLEAKTQKILEIKKRELTHLLEK